MAGHTGAQTVKTRIRMQHIKQYMEHIKSIASHRELLILNAIEKADIKDNSYVIAETLDKVHASSVNHVLSKYAECFPPEVKVNTILDPANLIDLNELSFEKYMVIDGVGYVPLSAVQTYVTKLVNELTKPVEPTETVKPLLLAIQSAAYVSNTGKDVITITFYPTNPSDEKLEDTFKRCKAGTTIGIIPAT